MPFRHIQPDYRHSIISLLSGVRQRFNPKAIDPHYPALSLPGNADNSLLLLVLDGLGADYLAQQPQSFLAHHVIDTLDTVFPSTTASAMTSYLTGASPQQHAITGWFSWFREIGCVTTVLPFTPRFRGPSLTDAGIAPQQLIGHDSLFENLPLPSHVIYPDYIVDSDYTVATSGQAQRHGYETLEEMFTILMALAQFSHPRYLFAYWSQFDALAHQYGVASDKVAKHFAQLDAACAKAFPKLARRGVDILVCADHGLVDTMPEHVITLDEHPPLQSMLTLPLCGEPRTAFCYVRAHKREAFERYIQENFAHASRLVTSETLISNGYFGLGPAHPQLSSRCGDYALLMKENYVIKDRLITEKPFHQIGIHGGLSHAEMRVPLIAYPAMNES